MWHSIENLFSTFNLQLGLLIGTGVLAICLLVLALTRWGSSSPVWKCVILSFAAHILLIVYAYGTQLIFDHPDPGPPGNDHLRVNLIASSDELTSELETVKAMPDWSKTGEESLLPQVVEALERPEIDSEVIIERVLPLQTSAPEFEDRPELPTPLQLDGVAEIQPDLIAELAPLERQFSKLDSPEMPIERRQEAAPDLIEPPPFNTPSEWSKLDHQNDFRPESTIDESLNPHQKGIDSTLIDPNSQFARSESTVQLPPPPLNRTDSFAPLSPQVLDARFKRVSSTWRAGDGKPMPEVYSLRNAVDRQQIVLQRGGSAETEAAVKEGLRWLVKSQEADGRWDADRWGAGIEKQVFGHDRKSAGADADTGITGLATLALLAGGHSHLEGSYQASIQRALDYLILKQRQNGDLAGDAKLFARTYCHSMALLALSEALAVTGDARLMTAVQKGVDYSVQAQNRIDGGWRYQPGDAGDMSQHGWQVLALQSAKMGGARVPEVVFDRMKLFVDSCSSGSYGGLSSYRPRQGVSTSMTAEALVCRFILNDELGYNTIMEAARRISTERPSALHINLYYWYYGTLAMYQVGGNDWTTWNAELKKTLLSTQVKTGHEAGSWNPDCLWGGYGGRVYSTALATLNLQVYYRYMPNNRSAAIIPDSSDSVLR